MRVAAPVLDLRTIPEPAEPTLEHDPNEETQLLYGEQVLVHEQQGEWVRVEAIEQPEWTHNQQWEGYPGWVTRDGLVADDPQWQPNLVVTDAVALVHTRPHEDQTAFLKLSLGTRLMAVANDDGWLQIHLLNGQDGWINEDQAEYLSDLEQLSLAERREQIIASAQRLVGTPYYWGGRSARIHGYRRPPNTAVDCSGLVNLCYRAAGVDIPRDAHEQLLRARAIPLADAQRGDLIFLADPEDREQITHVMLYLGDGRVIEGPGTGERVRQTDLGQKFGQDWEALASAGQTPTGRRITAGTYFP